MNAESSTCMFPRTGSSDAPGCPPNEVTNVIEAKGSHTDIAAMRSEPASSALGMRKPQPKLEEQHEYGDGAWKGVRCGSTAAKDRVVLRLRTRARRP